METLIDFVINNYILFLVIALILIFALIGYLVDITNINNNTKKSKIKPIAPIEDDVKKIHPSVEAYTNEDFDSPLIDDKNI